MAYYTSPLRLPKGKSGVFRVKHEVLKTETSLPLVTFRDAIFRGEKPTNIRLRKGTVIHRLVDNHGTWMSDIPCEVYDMANAVECMEGHVLVGGLGLGLAVEFLLALPQTKSVTVVEKSKDVIDLVWPHLSTINKKNLIHGDLFEFLKQKQAFDSAFYDIWRPTGERILVSHTMPLRAMSEGVIPQNKIVCWGEKTMIGQVQIDMATSVHLWGTNILELDRLSEILKSFDEGIKHPVFGPQWTFYNWIHKTQPTKETALAALPRFLQAISRPSEWQEWKPYEYGESLDPEDV